MRALRKSYQEEQKKVEADSVFQMRSYCCSIEWLTTCSNLVEYALKLHNDDRDDASYIYTFDYYPS